MTIIQNKFKIFGIVKKEINYVLLKDNNYIDNEAYLLFSFRFLIFLSFFDMLTHL